MIEVRSLSKKYGDNQVLNSIDINIADGKIIGLLGINGAGKSTLLKAITGMIQFDSGEVVIDGTNLLSDKTISHKKMGILFGSDVGLYRNLTVYENLMYFAELQGLDKKTSHKRIMQLSETFNYASFIDKKAGILSKGMTQKVVLARSVIHSPQNIIMDEPESGLDYIEMGNIANFILNQKEEGKAVIFSSHSLELIREISDEILELNQGMVRSIKDVSGIYHY